MCEQLTDITSGMSEEEKQDYEKKIRAKLQRGANLSVEELNYLRIHNPELYRSAMRVKTAKQQLKEQLRHCKSKQEANTLIVRAISRISDKDPDKTYLTAGLRKVAEEFKKSFRYANLPYNVATPILLTLLERFDNLGSFLVMVQKEVADRLAAKPGSKIYGTPSVKLAWYGTAERVGTIGRNVFWPAPNVDSALVRFTRYQADDPAAPGASNSTDDGTQRELVFRLIDAAFGQRRKTLHAALKTIAPSEAFSIAGIDPTRRGETLTIAEFTALAKAIESCGDGDEAQ